MPLHVGSGGFDPGELLKLDDQMCRSFLCILTAIMSRIRADDERREFLACTVLNIITYS